MAGYLKDKIYFWSKSYGDKWNIDLHYFIKNGFWMTLKQVLEIVAGMALFIIFARIAAKETLGYFQLVMSIFAAVSVLSIPGLNTSITRAVSRGYDGEYVYAVKKSFFWSLIGVPLLLFIGVYYYLFENNYLGITIIVSSILFPLFYAPNTWISFLQGKEQYRKIAVYGSFQILFNSIVTILAIFFSKDNALVIILVYLFSYSIFNIAYYYKTLAYIENSKVSGEVMEYGWFLTKIDFFLLVSENLDKIIIGTLLSPTALAIFTIVSAFPFKLKMVIKSILVIIFPKMSQECFRISNIFKKKQAGIISAVILLFMLIMGVAYFFTIEPLSKIFFGDKYLDYYQYGKIFTILVIIYVPLLLSGWYIEAKKMSKALVYINATSFIIKVTSLLIGVIFWGIVGGIWAYSINAVIILIMQLIAIYIEDNKFSKTEMSIENKV